MSQVPMGLSPSDVADALLGAAAQRRTLSLIVEPSAGGHEVLIETAEGMAQAMTMNLGMGEAVVARVALIAGLDVAAPAGQLGRVSVSVAGVGAELVAMTFYRGGGQGFEVRRLVSVEDAAPVGTRGARVADRVGGYRLIEKRGEGGMGVVYRAEHIALAKPVAVKILHANVAQDPRLATTLLREGRLASRAHHPGIVDVTDFGTTPDGRTYLVMELVEWPTLRDLLRGGAMDPDRAVAIARRILVALDEAHREGVVHRDLKPANVFVGPDDVVKIGDFGTARAMAPGETGVKDTRENTVSGSPDYMSPEHCRGLPTDRRTDIYAVGCMLFEMLTGDVPYPGESAVSVMIKQVNDPVPLSILAGASISVPLAGVVGRAMAKKVGERYPTGRDMVADLDRAALEPGGLGGRGAWK